jgi:HSP20 family protein
MLMSDPFRQLDRLTQQVFGTVARPATMALDAWREGTEFVVAVDLPGVDTESIDVTGRTTLRQSGPTASSAGS